MITIKNIVGCEYYTRLAQEDYYARGEKPGQWYGAGAEALGLTGQVSPEQLSAILAGHSPDGKPLVQIQAGRRHRHAWDVQMAAAKTVSALWAMCDEPIRKLVESAHYRSVDAALGYMEDHAIIGRRGQGGRLREHAGMVAAKFCHYTSRNMDPQLHTHVLVANIGIRGDSSSGTIDSHELYVHHKAADAVYQAKLAAILRDELGLKIQHQGQSFRIAGIPEKLVERFSSRRAEILKSLKEKGIEYSPKTAEIAALDTRRAKTTVPADQLFAQWRRIGQEYGFGPKQAAALIGSVSQTVRQDADASQTASQAVEIVRKAAEELGRQSGVFRESDLVRAAAVSAQHHGIDPQPVLAAIADEHRRGDDQQEQGRGQRRQRPDEREREERGRNHAAEEEPRETNRRMSTKFSRQLVEELEQSTAKLLENNRFRLSRQYVERFLSRGPELGEERTDSLLRITTAAGAFQCVEGLTDTGKTRLLAAAKEVWQDARFRVIGVTVTGRAARQFEAATGIETITIANLSDTLDRPLSATLKHHAKQILRAAAHKHTWKLPTGPANAETVIVVDDAHLVSAEDMNCLLGMAADAKSKVVLVGDQHQIEAIRQPGAFSYVVDLRGAARLGQFQRQHGVWFKDALLQMANGDLRGSMTQFALAGRTTVCWDQERAMTALVNEWNDNRTPELPRSLIVAWTGEKVAELNRRAQAARHQAGELGILKQRLSGTWVHANDRVAFVRGRKSIGYKAGDMGVVERVGLDTLTIRLDRTERVGLFTRPVRVTISPQRYADLQLGYATTVYSAQGMKVDRAFVLTEMPDLDSTRDRDIRAAYSLFSRAGENTQVFLYGGRDDQDLDLLARLERCYQEECRRQQQERQDARQSQRQQGQRQQEQSQQDTQSHQRTQRTQHKHGYGA